MKRIGINGTLLAIVSVTAMLLQLFAATVGNAAMDGRLYGGLLTGAFFPSSGNNDVGYNLEGCAGYKLTPNFGIELGLGYYSPVKYSFTARNNEYRWEGENKITAIPLTLTAKGFLPINETLSLYGGLGVGMYFSELDSTIAHSYSGTHDWGAGHDTARTTTLGYSAVIGANYMLSSSIAFIFEGKWFKADADYTTFEGLVLKRSESASIGGLLLSVGVKFH